MKKYIKRYIRTHVKNIIAGLLSVLLIGLIFNCYSYAAGSITESANVKVFVGGQQVNFGSTPITVNGQILLNSRELLVKLGIPDDGKHIQLDKNQKNLIISNGKKQIRMTVNSTKAAEGKSAKKLNAAPVFYKNIYYIPAKSTAQLLDMKYAWDDEEKSAYIQKQNEYNRVKTALDKAVAVSKAADKYQAEYSVESVSDYKDYPVTSKASTLSKVDKNKMIMTINGSSEDSSNGSSTSEYYLYNSCLYSKYSFKDRWEKSFISEREYKEWILNYDVSRFKISDILYCGLTVQENKKDNTILLKGNVYLHVNKADFEFEPVDTYLEIKINKSNYMISSITHTYSEYQNSDYFGRYLYSSSQTYKYLDYNGKFVVETPDESEMEIEGNDNSQNGLSPITLSRSEENKINGLSARVEKIPVDGAWENPCNLDSTEAIMFVIIKNKSDFDTFTGLSEDAKKVFINQIVQDNYGDYIGSERVYGKVVYDGKAYAGITTGYGKAPESVTLERYSFGAPVTVIEQDKKNNTYTEYK